MREHDSHCLNWTTLTVKLFHSVMILHWVEIKLLVDAPSSSVLSELRFTTWVTAKDSAHYSFMKGVVSFYKQRHLSLLTHVVWTHFTELLIILQTKLTVLVFHTSIDFTNVSILLDFTRFVPVWRYHPGSHTKLRPVYFTQEVNKFSHAICIQFTTYTFLICNTWSLYVQGCICIHIGATFSVVW